MSHRVTLIRPLEGWLTARRAITASVLSMSAVILIAATPGSPYHPVLPESQGNGPLELLTKLLFLDRLPHGILIALGFAAMISAGVTFLLMLWAAERGLISTRTVVTLTIAYHVAVLLLPLLLSRDVFSYAYYGRILSRYGGNPYVNTPADYPANDLFRFTWPDWRETPSVYGPVFVWMSGAITAVFRSIPDVIVAFRAIAVAASLASVWFVIKTVDRIRPSKTTYAAAMIGLNPVILFHTAGGGHVDVLVMLGVAAALYLIATDRALPATVALTAASLVKVSAVVPLILLIAYVASRAAPERRVRVLVTHIGTVAGIGLLAVIPFISWQNPTLGVVELAQHGSWIAPPGLVERILESIGRVVAGDVGASAGVALARLAMVVTLAAGLYVVLRQVIRHAREGSLSFLAAAWGWSFLLLGLFSPTLFAWYFAWMLPVAWALPLVPRRTLEFSFLALVTAQLTTESFQITDWVHVDLAFGHPILVVMLAWFLYDLWLRLKYDVPLDAETDLARDLQRDRRRTHQA